MKQLNIMFGSETYLRNCCPHKIYLFSEWNSYNVLLVTPRINYYIIFGNPYNGG